MGDPVSNREWLHRLKVVTGQEAKELMDVNMVGRLFTLYKVNKYRCAISGHGHIIIVQDIKGVLPTYRLFRSVWNRLIKHPQFGQVSELPSSSEVRFYLTKEGMRYELHCEVLGRELYSMMLWRTQPEQVGKGLSPSWWSSMQIVQFVYECVRRLFKDLSVIPVRV